MDVLLQVLMILVISSNIIQCQGTQGIYLSILFDLISDVWSVKVSMLSSVCYNLYHDKPKTSFTCPRLRASGLAWRLG
jgi:hypothetical protein